MPAAAGSVIHHLDDADFALRLDDRTIAYHEAGHAVVYLMAGWTGIFVEIPDKKNPERARSGAEPKPEVDARDRIRLRMGGLAVEEGILGRVAPTRGSNTDRYQILQLLETISDSHDERQTVFDALWREMQAAFAMSDVRAAVDAIAAELLVRRRLDDADLRRISAASGLQTTLPLSDDDDRADDAARSTATAP